MSICHCRADDGIHIHTYVSTLIIFTGKPVLPAYGKRSDSAFGTVVVQRDDPVFKESQKRGFLIESIVYSSLQAIGACIDCFYLSKESVRKRLDELLTLFSFLINAELGKLVILSIYLRDHLQSFCRNRIRIGNVRFLQSIHPPPSHMRPTSTAYDFLGKIIVSAVAICFNISFVILKIVIHCFLSPCTFEILISEYCVLIIFTVGKQSEIVNNT